MGKLSMVYLCCCFRREVDSLVDYSWCTICPIRSDPFYIVTYYIGNYFLDTQYV